MTITTDRGGPDPMRVALLTVLAMLAFAANSLLCRLALSESEIEPAGFTAVRVIAGAAVLWLLVSAGGRGGGLGGSWKGAAALAAYAVAFSFAYVGLSAGTGALLLFGAVQATMIGSALLRGDRLTGWQWTGLLLALAGLVVLLAPGARAPDPLRGLLMIGAGVAWGAYTLLGRGAGDPLATTAGNFVRAVPLALVPVALTAEGLPPLGPGVLYAVLSGAVASGMGYAIWYAAVPGLTATRAASVQLSVPVITAIGGVAMLGEVLSLRLVAASVVVLGGIALVIARQRPAASAAPRAAGLRSR